MGVCVSKSGSVGTVCKSWNEEWECESEGRNGRGSEIGELGLGE